MYTRLMEFNKQKALLVDSIVLMGYQGRQLQIEDLIQTQRSMSCGFMGLKERNEKHVVDVFRTYTRSPGLPWGVSFIVYIVNHGIAESVASIAELPYPKPLPNTPFSDALQELPRTNTPLMGDIVVTDNSAFFVSSVSNQVRGIGAHMRGKSYGVVDAIVDSPLFFIDMGQVYADFMSSAQSITNSKVAEIA